MAHDEAKDISLTKTMSLYLKEDGTSDDFFLCLQHFYFLYVFKVLQEEASSG